MRIISGMRRGRKLQDFSGDDVRPTTDRVKESMFNLLQPFVADSVCLDMFAGSGSLSFEAVSRGAKRAVLLDKDKRSIEIIKKNAGNLSFTDKCEIVQTDCFDYAKRTDEKFDIIFLDPPYNKGLIEPVLGEIVNNSLLTDDGIIVLESDDTDFFGDFEGLSVYRQRRYGRTYITIYKIKQEESI